MWAVPLELELPCTLGEVHWVLTRDLWDCRGAKIGLLRLEGIGVMYKEIFLLFIDVNITWFIALRFLWGFWIKRRHDWTGH